MTEGSEWPRRTLPKLATCGQCGEPCATLTKGCCVACYHRKLRGNKARPIRNQKTSKYDCNCGQTFDTCTGLANHQRCCSAKLGGTVHAAAKQWRCKWCGAFATGKKGQQRRKGPDGPSTLCNSCGNRFARGRGPPNTGHVVGTGKMGYQCATCGKRFSNNQSLGGHVAKSICGQNQASREWSSANTAKPCVWCGCALLQEEICRIYTDDKPAMCRPCRGHFERYGGTGKCESCGNGVAKYGDPMCGKWRWCEACAVKVTDASSISSIVNLRASSESNVKAKLRMKRRRATFGDRPPTKLTIRSE